MKKSGCIKVAFLRKQLLDICSKIYLFNLDVFVLTIFAYKTMLNLQ